jgi:hypothetical protein
LLVNDAIKVFHSAITACCLDASATARTSVVSALPSPAAKPRYDSVEAAALRLSTTPIALRARCRRRSRREGRDIVAHLGGGIIAIKFGVSWRVRFPD